MTARGAMPRPNAARAMPRLPLPSIGSFEAIPPLKWAGGKRWLVPKIQELVRPLEYSRLVEPFAGGLAIALGLNPRRALLQDANPHLINFYKWLQHGLNVERTHVRFANDQSTFYKNRERFNELATTGGGSSEEAAALFYYLNRTAFNGLCRFNRRGEFNVPFGRYTKIPYRTDFSDYAEAFSRFDFEVGDFQTIKTRRGDFLYADPPYDVQFTSYSADSFSWDDQVRLAEWLAELTVPVVASNQATERILDLYRGLGFTVETLNAPRRISCTGDRSDALEMLALGPNYQRNFKD
jgi:DNA adenine methylase